MKNKIIYKDVPNYENYYLASSDGHIYDKKTGYQVKEYIKTKGKSQWFNVVLKKNNYRHDFNVAKLIGSTFIGDKNCLGYSHIDGNKFNNDVNNLKSYANKNNVILHLPNDTKVQFNSLQKASEFLGYNKSYLSAYLTSHNNDKFVITNNKFICEIEFIKNKR